MKQQIFGVFGTSALFGSSAAVVDFTSPPGISGGTQPLTIAWVQEPRSPVAFGALLNWLIPGTTNPLLIYQQVGVDTNYNFVADQHFQLLYLLALWVR
jgi:hypothetical protein